MDEEIENLLRETKALVEENNKILKGIRRSNRISSFFRFVYWAIIIVVTIGTYAYIQPYLNSVSKLYNDLETTNNSITTTQNSFGTNLKEFFLGTSSIPKK